MNETPELRSETKQKDQPNLEVFDWLQCIVAAIVFAILFFSFFVRTSIVIGSSMVPTLTERDILLVNRVYSEPKYGDIVVLRKASFGYDTIIKRVIATQGQTVDIDFNEGVVYVDGKALDEPYTNALTYESEGFSGPITVPEGCVFVMGDNRNRSTDSRSASLGCVDTRLLIGKAFFRLSPLSKLGKVGGLE